LRIARICCTFVVIVTINGSVDASGTIIFNTLLGSTIIAIIADNGGIYAASIRIAGIGSTDVRIIADYRCFSATILRMFVCGYFL